MSNDEPIDGYTYIRIRTPRQVWVDDEGNRGDLFALLATYSPRFGRYDLTSLADRSLIALFDSGFVRRLRMFLVE